jgi:hypothetical protein
VIRKLASINSISNPLKLEKKFNRGGQHFAFNVQVLGINCNYAEEKITC